MLKHFGLLALLGMTTGLALGQQSETPQPVRAPSVDNSKTGPNVKTPISFDVVTKKPDDQIETTPLTDGVMFDIKSPSGIGSATIRPKAGTWPRKVVLRLRLKGLESLTISNGKVTVEASVPSHGGRQPRVYLTQNGQEKPLGKGDPYWTEIKVIDGQTVPLKDGYFEVALPAALLDDSHKALTVRWIDFYRG